MHPDLQRFFNHVWPLLWPWLVWNLVRVARWHERTGQDALITVDCFGNVRFAYVADGPAPESLYTYEAPRVAAWEHPALGSDVPVSVCGCVRSKSAIVMLGHDMVRHDPVKSGMVIYRHDMVRHDHGLHVRGPPWPGLFPNPAFLTGWQPPGRAKVLGQALLPVHSRRRLPEKGGQNDL